MTDAKRCGPHVEMTKTDHVRVTRCACGAVHVTMLKHGVTVQMSEEEFVGVARDLGLAAHECELAKPRSGSVRPPSERIN
jgi:hypothetical protein